MTQRLIIEVAPVERLVEAVAGLRLHDPIVLGLPPGGLFTALRVARALQLPLDMLLPRHDDEPIRIDRGLAWPALAGRSAVPSGDQILVSVERICTPGASSAVPGPALLPQLTMP